MNRIWSWYLLPWVPGFGVLALSSIISNHDIRVLPLVFVVGVFYLIGRLNRRAAQRMQLEIDALNAMEREQS